MKQKNNTVWFNKYNLLFAGVVITSLIYIGWRIFFTIPFSYGLLSIIMGIALVTAEAVAILESFSHHRNMRTAKSPEKPVIPDNMYPDVDVFIATHSEEPDLLCKTINGCLNMQYPDPGKVHIYLCDDMNRPEMRRLAKQMGIGYFGLSDNMHAKAGNLNNALSKTNSQLVATFDSDMIPTSDFLTETVPFFFLPQMIREEDGTWRLRTEEELAQTKDEKIGFIQTPQSFYNADMFQFNLFAENSVPNEQDYFFREINVGRNRTNSVVYAGSNTVILRKALEEIGGIKTDTITEDFATGLSIQSKGYTCYAIDKTLAHGLAPKDFKSLIKQRQRWARGCVQTLLSPKFLFGSLPLRSKISYLVCFLYWWTFLRRLIYILSPILFAVFGIVSVDCSFWELLLIWLPSYVIYNRALRVMSGNIRNQRWSNVADTILFPYLIVPVIAETFGNRMHKFNVTPKLKTSSKNSELRYAIPHIILAILSITGLYYCVRDILMVETYGSAIILYWLLFNLYYLVISVIFIAGRINYREDERLYASVPMTLIVDNRELKGITSDISEGGMGVLLDSPEFIPYDKDVLGVLSYKDYTAEMKAKVLHVQQVGDKWKYSLKITDCTEENRMKYLQIVFDRDHTLAKTIQTGLLKDTVAPVKGSIKRTERSNRRLPRVPMNQTMNTLDGQTVTCLNFNYEYILLDAEGGLPDALTIALEADILLECKKVQEKGGDSKSLYQISEWREISGSEQFRKCFLGLLGYAENVSGYALKRAAAGSV